MPDAKEISALTTAESTSASDLFETALPNAMTETGYISRKVTLGTIANFLLSTLQLSSLNTTVKNIIGAINELAQGSGQSLDALNDVDIDAQTLTDGQGIVYDAIAQKWKNGSVGGGGGHTYSTTEQVVGTWIDGRDVYEKTFQSTTPSTVNTVSIIEDISSLNVDVPILLTGNVGNVPINWRLDASNEVICFVNSAKTGIAMQIANSSLIEIDCFLTLRYTKSST